MRLLVVGDDPSVRNVLRLGLEARGVRCTPAADAAGAREALASVEPGHFDLILLDVVLPDGTGWELLEELRRGRIATPVIFLTARDAVADRVKGLRLGADDYVVKPFDLAELLARVDAVLRRGAPSVDVGDLHLDLARRAAERGGRRIELSRLEFDVLWALASARGAPVSRERLLEDVWRLGFDPGSNVVEVTVARLRRKLELHGPRVIETVPGEGYRLVPGVAGARDP